MICTLYCHMIFSILFITIINVLFSDISSGYTLFTPTHNTSSNYSKYLRNSIEPIPSFKGIFSILLYFPVSICDPVPG